jgi:hypothetical protein
LGSFNSHFGCRKCWVPLKELGNVVQEYPMKTALEIKSLHKACEEMKENISPRAAAQLFKRYSIPNLPLSPVFHLSGDWCQQSPGDLLHAERLGNLKAEICHILYEKITPEQFKIVANKISSIQPPRGGTNLGNSLMSAAKFTGKQIDTLSYVLPIALYSVVDISQVWFHCFLAHLSYYRILSEKNISREKLGEIKQLMKIHHEVYRELYPGLRNII